MPTARDLRAAALRRFKNGELLPVLAGFALVMLLGSLVEFLLYRFGLSRGWVENVPLIQLLGRHGIDFSLIELELGQLGSGFHQLGAEFNQLGAEAGQLGFAFNQLAAEFNQLGAELAASMNVSLSSTFIPLIEPWYVVAAILAYILCDGIFTFGCAVVAISAMRGGATAFQALSGFSFSLLWRTALLGLLNTLLVLLGTLLFIAPGLMAHYSYRMAFMLLADNPDWSPWRALRESRKLMYGHRLRLAALDASFTGWLMLLLVTNLAGLFVLPYFATANAAFYEDLLDRTGR